MHNWFIKDYPNGSIINVGSRVCVAEHEHDQGTVVLITEPDGDWNDEVKHAVEYPPRVYVHWDDNTEPEIKGEDEGWSTYYNKGLDWSGYGEAEYICEELVVVV